MSLSFASSDDVLALLQRGKPLRPVAAFSTPIETPRRLVPRNGIPTELVISGGQTGADRAGLDAALAVGLPIDGHCPAGRLSEDGTIPDIYPRRETGTCSYGERTALNVKHSVATLVLSFEPVDELSQSGSGKTVRLCKKHERPCLNVTLHPVHSPSEKSVAGVVAWLRKRNVVVLNVAGPRESKAPGLQAAATAFLIRVLGQEQADV